MRDVLSRVVILMAISSPVCVMANDVAKVIQLKQGSIRGVVHELARQGDKDLMEKKVEIYKAIPFASPPTGSLRFLPPVTAHAWKGTKAGDKFAPVCPQSFPDTSNKSQALLNMSSARYQEILRAKAELRDQSEDCLYLNVYAPHRGRGNGDDDDGLHPVVLFIHGDDFTWGSGNLYDPSPLVVLGRVVAITMNYRLGIFGFLNANRDGDSKSPANFGILDQIAALHWIQENIVSFGGDPKRVTLLGHGTGAACAHFLMTSEALPEGVLFQRAGLLSGSGMSPLSIARHPAATTGAVADALNCSAAKSNDDVLHCLRTKSLADILRLTPMFSESRFYPTWGPSYDGIVVQKFHYDVRDYLDRLARYDLMFSVASGDAIQFLNDRQLQFGMEIKDRNKILSDFVSDTYSVHQREIFSAIVTKYTDWRTNNPHPASIRDMTIMALQDGLIVAPLVQIADVHSSLNKHSWFYVFDHQSKNSLYKQRQGAVHGEQLKYIFGIPLTNPNGHNEIESTISKLMMTFWSNFASSGDPNARVIINPSVPNENGSGWSSYDPKSKKYLHIGGKSRVRDHYRCEELAIWLNLIPDLQLAAKSSLSSSDYKEVSSRNLTDSELTEVMLSYQTYDDLLTLIPDLKDQRFFSHGRRHHSTPASSEVVWPNATKNQDRSYSGRDGLDVVNATYVNGHEFANYSTALSVTIAIGCSLLVLNVLIFAAVYYQKEKARSQEIKLEPYTYMHPAKSAHSISQFIQEVPGKRQRAKVTTSNGSDLQQTHPESHGPIVEISPPPRKSALKRSSQGSLHRMQHLPPPEFADNNSSVALPAFTNSDPYDGFGETCGRPGAVTATTASSTLPLKSNLKRARRRSSVEELRV